MEILAITSPESDIVNSLQFLEITTFLSEGIELEAVVQGSFAKPAKRGTLKIYVSGYVDKATIDVDSAPDAKVSLHTFDGYSLVSVSCENVGSECRFAFRIRFEKPATDSLDFETRVYGGSPGLAVQLSQEEIWNHLVPIDALRICLLYSGETRLVSSKGKPRDFMSPSARQKKLFKKAGRDDWHLLEWEDYRISLTHPFVGAAQFAKVDRSTVGTLDRLNKLDSEMRVLRELSITSDKQLREQFEKLSYQCATIASRQKFLTALLIALIAFSIVTTFVILMYERIR